MVVLQILEPNLNSEEEEEEEGERGEEREGRASVARIYPS